MGSSLKDLMQKRTKSQKVPILVVHLTITESLQNLESQLLFIFLVLIFVHELLKPL